MNDEELARLMQGISEQIENLSDPEKKLAKGEKNRKLLLQLQLEALNRIKAAKEKGSLQQEIKAGVDYTLLKEYGGKHPLLINYIKSQAGWYGF